MEIEIDCLALGGYGLGRREGKVIFAPYGVPGDLLDVEVTEDHRDYAFARIRGIKKPSSHRVTPPCPVFGSCGGCQWLHIDYPIQLRAKETLAKRELRGVLENDRAFQPIIPSEPYLEHRTRAKLRLFKDQIGFYQEKSHQIVAMGHCPVMTSIMNRALLTFYHHLKELKEVEEIDLFSHGGEKTLLISMKSRGRLKAIHQIFHALKEDSQGQIGLRVLWKGKASHLGPRTMEEEILGHKLLIGHDTFFQNNRFLRESLAALVLEQAMPWLDGEVLELYAGVGTFTVPLVKAGTRMTAVEGHVPSAQFLKENAPQAEVWKASCEKALEQLKDRSFSLIILDPPRTGCSPHARQAIRDLTPEAIIYVSCNPATMARDMALWKEQSYHLTFIQPLDMFPHTGHVEMVGVIVKG